MLGANVFSTHFVWTTPSDHVKVKLHGYLVFNKCAPGISVVYVCEQTLGIAVNLQTEAILVTLIVERVFRETAFMRSLVCFAQPCNEKAESVGSFSYEPTVPGQQAVRAE